LTKAGKVELVGTTARGRAGRRVDVGQTEPVSGAKPIGGGVLLDRGRTNWVFAVRGGRVRAIAVAGAALARSPKRLRAAMARVLSARASHAKRVFVPNTAAQAALSGNVLAGTSDPRLNAAFAFLCSAQLQAY
jgi:hypothetical protein